MSLRSQRFGLFSLSIAYVKRDCAIGYFSVIFLYSQAKTSRKRSFHRSFQTNINLHMFRYEFVVKNTIRFFDGPCGFYFFPAKIGGRERY